MADEKVSLQQLDEDWNRALAVVAHPDDLEFGTASAIARWTGQGKEVTELLVTRGEAGIASMHPAEAGPLRTEEQLAAARVVGASGVDFLDFPDGTLEYGLELRRALARAIRTHRPDVVVSINFRETFDGADFYNHADHRAVGPALLDAVRDAANRWVFPELADEGLGPWKGVRFAAFSSSPRSTHYTPFTEKELATGIASLDAHEVYMRELEGFDHPAMLREGAERAGERCGADYAVLFEVIGV
ncbi:PIG-L deacetylase family protein [Nocardiopsis composta]|uniref:LmbE family N-acetylglucosaminyl deacetylase n=1 Tax=Nocardiopsis composta TaxID=157465 RepID=A0A7W8QGY0_9ACTN|nr:PIG-L deacetylase family protein [Nocardiopsis composta]MBB5430247.1 LmbE family N-acetylglucosaminyl deacetylase [Nocardiopsis composta]